MCDSRFFDPFSGDDFSSGVNGGGANGEEIQLGFEEVLIFTRREMLLSLLRRRRGQLVTERERHDFTNYFVCLVGIRF